VTVRISDVAVIGAGPGGCAAAVQCTRLGLSTTLMDMTGRAGGLIREARLIENSPALAAPVTGEEFADRLEAALTRFSIGVMNDSVQTVERSGSLFSLHTLNGRHSCRTVILATGTEPADLQLNGDTGLVLRSFLTLPDHLSGRSIAIIGGGEAAFDYALHADDLGAAVSLVIRGSTPKAMGVLLNAVLSRRDIRLIYETRPVTVLREGSMTLLECLSSGTSSSLRVDAVLAAVGRRAVLPDLPELCTDLSSAIITASPVPGIFICGDALLGSLGQAGTAIGQGLQAAMGCMRHLGNRAGGGP